MLADFSNIHLSKLFWLICALFAMAFVSTATPSDAKTVSYFKSATNGKSQWIDSYTGWKPNCGFLNISVDITKRPAHGNVSPKIETRKITRAQAGSAGKCLGKPTRAVAVYYKAKRGYRGIDKFTVRMRTPGQADVNFVYTVNVR